MQNFRNTVLALLFIFPFTATAAEIPMRRKTPVDYVNPFIGTSNYGATNPGALCPNGMMSVSPFNVMGSADNQYDKEKRWWSTPYDNRNVYFTGYSHVNLSGVGCPDLGALLLMPTTGEMNVDYREYGSRYTDEEASPGYYYNYLDKYGVATEATATTRTGATRFTFPAGKSNILLNLGEGLTNESGAVVRQVSNTEIEGSKLLGTFCYNSGAVFPIYFVMRVSKAPVESGFWKMQRPRTGIKAEWDSDQGKYKLYRNYGKELAGDDIGAYFTFDTEADEQIEVRIGVSFVSIENARLNLDAESDGKDFSDIWFDARRKWDSDLSRIEVEGGTEEQKTVFYTALYHALIHPNILSDVNGDYPAMESNLIMNTGGKRYTFFSLWDTYRNLHQLLTLVYPERQKDMILSMIGMYREHGWLPKWELYGRETLAMEGDPAIPVIVDTWMKGHRYFDPEEAYGAMYRSATMPGKDNLMRPDNDDYMALGYVPLREEFDNSVSHALEYYIADHALYKFAEALGKKQDAKLFRERSLGYKNYYCPQYGTFRPKLPDGKFIEPFDPVLGANFEPNPGFHEGNAWNYTFYVPHDVYGLAKLMVGNKKFVERLQSVFDNGYYDPANEPDIAYPYLFSYFKDEQWRTQKLTRELLSKYYTTRPDGLPGNDDTGTMSAWAVFSMMGFYPDCPGEPYYTITSPVFDKVTIQLDADYYPAEELVIESKNNSPENIYIQQTRLGDKKFDKFRISHKELTEAGHLMIELGPNKR